MATTSLPRTSLTHLDLLEAEAIYIIREAVAQSRNPVMLYSVGKDSSVMLHLAVKAFSPSPLPFPLLHIDTTWKFREMIEFRDWRVAELGVKLIVHINHNGIAQGLQPFGPDAGLYTDVMKTQALIQAIESYGFDTALGGARRDEEKSRAKERVFSFRTAAHRWDPRRQRPELWNLYNGRVTLPERVRVFPLSNWTELDVWEYIGRERLPVVPLYFARPRPVVSRSGLLIMVDDDRLPLAPGEVPWLESVRFRTLGCYPLTAAIRSTATMLDEVIAETRAALTSERQGRLIDHDEAASMERKKQEGYF